MGWGKFLDGHAEKGLILSGLLFADSRTPCVEFLIPFEEQNDLGVIGDFVGKLRMLSEVPIELHPQQAVSCFENAQRDSPRLSRRGCHGFEADERHVCSQGDEVQLFESDDLAIAILHENDVIAGFFAQVFLIWIAKPHSQRVADGVEEQLYFRFHIHGRSNSEAKWGLDLKPDSSHALL